MYISGSGKGEVGLSWSFFEEAECEDNDMRELPPKLIEGQRLTATKDISYQSGTGGYDKRQFDVC